MFAELIRSFRILRRDRGFALLTVLVLGLGIGATTALFGVLDSVLWRPLPFDESERLVSVLEGARGENLPTSPAGFVALAEESEALTDVTATFYWTPVLRGAERPTEVQGLATTAGLFDLLRSRALLGRAFESKLAEAPEAEAQVVVLGHSLWQRAFGGDREILGREISLDGEIHTVVAVMPADFAFPTFWAEGAELWAPFRFSPEQRSSGSRFLRVFARLEDGFTLEQARAEASLLAKQIEASDPRDNAGMRLQVSPLLEPTVGDTRTALWVLFGMVGLVLLVACANVASLFFARAVRRRQELAVRRALGAGRARSAVHLLGESLWLALFGGLLGLAVGAWSLDAIVAFGPEDLPRLAEIEMEPRALLFALAVALGTGLVFGLVPVLAQSRWDLRQALQPVQRSSGDAADDRWRRGLVIVEVALTVVLLAGAGLMMRSFHHLSEFDPGFQREQLLTLKLSLRGTEHEEADAQSGFYRSVLESVGALPGVSSAGLINHLPVGGDIWTHAFYIEGRPEPQPGAEPKATVRVASLDLLATLGIERVAGRSFGPGDHVDAPRVALVNEALAQQYFPGVDVVGQRFRRGRDADAPEWTIVGVVRDFRQFQLTDEIRPEVIFPYAQNPLRFWPKASLVVRTETDPAALVATVQDALWRLDPDLSIAGVRPMATLLDDTIGESRFQAFALAVFALAALVLSAVGVYAVMSYTVVSRRAEIGIRMAIGAGRRQILSWIVAGGLRLVGIGIAVGLGLSWLARRSMQSLVFGVQTGDLPTLLAAGLVLAVVAIGAILRPAMRAAGVDPMSSLRGD